LQHPDGDLSSPRCLIQIHPTHQVLYAWPYNFHPSDSAAWPAAATLESEITIYDDPSGGVPSLSKRLDAYNKIEGPARQKVLIEAECRKNNVSATQQL
jgi:hypothetical protein